MKLHSIANKKICQQTRIKVWKININKSSNYKLSKTNANYTCILKVWCKNDPFAIATTWKMHTTSKIVLPNSHTAAIYNANGRLLHDLITHVLGSWFLGSLVHTCRSRFLVQRLVCILRHWHMGWINMAMYLFLVKKKVKESIPCISCFVSLYYCK